MRDPQVTVTRHPSGKAPTAGPLGALTCSASLVLLPCDKASVAAERCAVTVATLGVRGGQWPGPHSGFRPFGQIPLFCK